MIVEEVRDAVREGGLLARGRPVVVMLSGGRDSICLLDVAIALLGSSQVSALHVNYGLRLESDEDERHCAAVSAQASVELELVRASRVASEQTGNVQAWAREVRYSAAQAAALARDGIFAAGHTASDQVETILYRLAASPGRRALLGMPASDGRLIRPLLTITRQQSTAYCQALGLAWRDDVSNEDDTYARTRVRSGLLPAFRAVHPAAEANVLRTAALLRGETELLQELVDRELDGHASIAVARLGELPAALARLVLIRLAEDATGTYVPQAGERVQELVALGRRGGRAELHLGGRAGAVIEDGTLRMIKLPPRA